MTEINATIKGLTLSISDADLTAALTPIVQAIVATTTPTPDTTAPSAPTNLTATPISPNQIHLNWDAAHDNVAVTGYNLYMNGSKAATLLQVAGPATVFYDELGLAPNTAYVFATTSFDAAGNESIQSTPVSATTLPLPSDLTPPSIPTGITATAVSPTQINLAWAASTTTNTQHALAGYNVYRGGTKVGTSSTPSFSDTGLMPNTAYIYTFSSYDDANPANISGQSDSVSATTQAAPVPQPSPGLITDKLPHPMTVLARPAANTSVIEPMNGLKLWRITNAAVGQACIPAYSTVQAFNADESLMILYHTTPARSGSAGHHLYSGKPPFGYIKQLPISPIDIEQFYWHPSDPDILIYNGTDFTITKYQVSTGVKTKLKQWPTNTAYEYADSHGSPSLDGKFIIGLKVQSNNLATIYHLDTDTPTAIVRGGANTQPLPSGWAGPDVAPSGKFAYWHGDVYDGQFQHVRRLSINHDQSEVEHADCGRYADGRDFYATVSFDDFNGYSGLPNAKSIGSLVIHDLDTGNFKVVIGPETGYPYTPSGTHISCKSFQALGWVTLSSTGDPAGQDLLDNELYTVNVGAPETVYRLAHTRTFAQNSTRGDLAYWAEAHPSMSPKGTYIIFGSDWGDSGSVDTYLLVLPPLGS